MKAECKARQQVELVRHEDLEPQDDLELQDDLEFRDDLECSAEIQDENYSDESMMEIPAPQIIISD
jgi:hypothetical protein